MLKVFHKKKIFVSTILVSKAIDISNFLLMLLRSSTCYNWFKWSSLKNNFQWHLNENGPKILDKIGVLKPGWTLDLPEALQTVIFDSLCHFLEFILRYLIFKSISTNWIVLQVWIIVQIFESDSLRKNDHNDQNELQVKLVQDIIKKRPSK